MRVRRHILYHNQPFCQPLCVRGIYYTTLSIYVNHYPQITSNQKCSICAWKFFGILKTYHAHKYPCIPLYVWLIRVWRRVEVKNALYVQLGFGGVFNIQYSLFNIEYWIYLYRHTHLMNKSIGEFLVNSPKDLWAYLTSSYFLLICVASVRIWYNLYLQFLLLLLCTY